MTPRLHGLLLAGGKSSRMGRDKASLAVGSDDLTQAQRATGLLRKFCASIYLSLRVGQSPPQGAEGENILIDSPLAEGPLSGILAAFEKDAQASWLVLACDLPFLTEEVVSTLIARRDLAGESPFTAFASSVDGLPEPLCAIYGPEAFPVLKRHAALGHFCPRRIMIEESAALFPLPDGATKALTNLNTPEDLEEAVGRRIHLSWFGRLAELRGQREETVFTKEKTSGEFFHALNERHGLEIDLSCIRIAINDEFADRNQTLRTGDKVAFLPPFSGG